MKESPWTSGHAGAAPVCREAVPPAVAWLRCSGPCSSSWESPSPCGRSTRPRTARTGGSGGSPRSSPPSGRPRCSCSPSCCRAGSGPSPATSGSSACSAATARWRSTAVALVVLHVARRRAPTRVGTRRPRPAHGPAPGLGRERRDARAVRPRRARHEPAPAPTALRGVAAGPRAAREHRPRRHRPARPLARRTSPGSRRPGRGSSGSRCSCSRPSPSGGSGDRCAPTATGTSSTRCAGRRRPRSPSCCTPPGHRGVQFRPGQFAWLKIGTSPFVFEEHPFTIASAATEPWRKEFTIRGTR